MIDIATIFNQDGSSEGEEQVRDSQGSRNNTLLGWNTDDCLLYRTSAEPP